MLKATSLLAHDCIRSCSKILFFILLLLECHLALRVWRSTNVCIIIILILIITLCLSDKTIQKIVFPLAPYMSKKSELSFQYYYCFAM